MMCPTGPAQAQAWPAKPIRLVIGFAPGGAADYVARTLSDPLGRALGQSVVVENKAGAGSSLAADFVAKAPPDGYTLLIASPSSISVNPALNAKLSYSAKDLVPVARVTSSPLVVAVNPGGHRLDPGVDRCREEGARLAELHDLGQRFGAAPGRSALQPVAGVEMVHIPYKGGAPAIASVTWCVARGLSACIAGVAARIEADFLRWHEFDKSARLACHSSAGRDRADADRRRARFAFKYVNGHPKNTARRPAHGDGLRRAGRRGHRHAAPAVGADADHRHPHRRHVGAGRQEAGATRQPHAWRLIGNGAQSEFQALAFRDLVGIATCACSTSTRGQPPS
jgi:hypothetical protein